VGVCVHLMCVYARVCAGVCASDLVIGADKGGGRLVDAGNRLGGRLVDARSRLDREVVTLLIALVLVTISIMCGVVGSG
jgi:hypothetical protein